MPGDIPVSPSAILILSIFLPHSSGCVFLLDQTYKPSDILVDTRAGTYFWAGPYCKAQHCDRAPPSEHGDVLSFHILGIFSIYPRDKFQYLFASGGFFHHDGNFVTNIWSSRIVRKKAHRFSVSPEIQNLGVGWVSQRTHSKDWISSSTFC